MAEKPNAYVPKNPGDIIRSSDWNELQIKAREEIRAHKHTGNEDGTQIPRTGIEANAIDGSLIDPKADVIVNTLTTNANLTVKGELSIKNTAILSNIQDLLEKVKGLETSKVNRGAGGDSIQGTLNVKALIIDGNKPVPSNIADLVDSKVNRAGDTIMGNLGIGTAGISAQKLIVQGTWNTGKDANSGMGNSGQLAIKGNAAQLDFIDTDNADWAIHVNSNKMYFIREPWIYDSLILDGNGKVGIGIDSPSEKLEVTGRIKAGRLTIGAWPASANYDFIGTTALDQTNAINYALLQSAVGGDIGHTFLNSPSAIHLRIGNTEKITIDANTVNIAGNLTINGKAILNDIADLQTKFNALDSNKVNRSGDTITGTLRILGIAHVTDGNSYAVPNNRMSSGSLTVGSTTSSYGGGQDWNVNTAGLLLETQANTEIAVHDSGNRVASLMYYEGDNVNRITIGRSMHPNWGVTPVRIAGNLNITGNIIRDNIPLANTEYTIELCGSAFESSEGNTSFLNINSVSVGMTPTRGLNTVILNPDGTVKNSATHDVYAAATTWNIWADWVNANAAFGNVVAVATYDALTNAPRGGSAELLLSSILANNAFTVATANVRSPYALLFMKGGIAREVAMPWKGTNAHIKSLSRDLVPEPDRWRAAGLINGWVDYGNGYNPTQYFKDSDDVVWLRGLVKSGAFQKPIFILPDGYRPSYRQIYSVCSNDATARVDITTDGQVLHWAAGSNLWLSLEGITIRTTPKKQP